MNQLYKFFLDEIERMFNETKSACDNRISKVREGYPIHSDIIRELNARELDLERQLAQKCIDRFFREMEKDYNLDSELTPETSFLNCCIKLNITNDKTAITLLADYKSNENLQSYYREELKNKSLINQNLEGEIKGNYNNNYWIGHNETEIIQLLYALIECGRLEKKGKIRMVESIADFLGFKLKNDWKSKLSHAVHRSNDDTNPSVFDDLKNGWENYKNKKIQESISKR